GVRQPARLDWWGNLTFAAGLIAVLVGITYGIQPYGGHRMGGTLPLLLRPVIRGPVGPPPFSGVATPLPDPKLPPSLVPHALLPSAPPRAPASAQCRWGPGCLDFLPLLRAAGLLPADTRLQLRGHAAVGGHRDAAADRRLPRRRPGVRVPVGPVRRPAVRHW